MSVITLVRQGPFLLLQFNTTCDESIKACDAMCCRMRPFFNVTIDKEETHIYQTDHKDGKLLLASKSNGDCVYLEGNRCSIYSWRPRQCREWHCSPLGNKDNPEITKRENGWLLVVGSNEVLNELNKK